MARGLSDEDLAGLRQQLDAGKRPRVQLSGPHFPVGATGTVVRVGNPAIDGPDYLRVRVKVDNMTDELAFGPAELKLPGRATKAATRPKPTKLASAPAAPARTAPSTAPPGEPLVEPAPAKPTRGPRPTPAKTTPAKPAPVKAAPAKTATATTTPAKAVGSTAAPGRGTRRKIGPAQKVTFTVASVGAAWSLTATRGSKNVVKNVGLPPGLVGALVELLDQPALSEAVAEINDAALIEAQLRADQLRAELSQLEAVLATHSRPAPAG